jgi:excisionase family DNA binding protein
MANEEEILNKLNDLSFKFEEQTMLKKPVLNFIEGCRYLNLSESYVYKLTSAKQIPHFCPLGKKIYFKREDLDDWLLRNRQSTVGEVEKLASSFTVKKEEKKTKTIL